MAASLASTGQVTYRFQVPVMRADKGLIEILASKVEAVRKQLSSSYFIGSAIEQRDGKTSMSYTMTCPASISIDTAWADLNMAITIAGLSSLSIGGTCG